MASRSRIVNKPAAARRRKDPPAGIQTANDVDSAARASASGKDDRRSAGAGWRHRRAQGDGAGQSRCH